MDNFFKDYSLEKRIEFYEQDLDIRFESIKLEIDLCVKIIDESLEKLAEKKFKKLAKSLEILESNIRKGNFQHNLDSIQAESKKIATFSLFKINKKPQKVFKNDIGNFKVSVLIRIKMMLQTNTN